MLDTLTKFLTSEDAVVVGTGLGSILGGLVIAYKAVQKGKGGIANLPALVPVGCSPELLPRVIEIDKRLVALCEEIEENDDAGIAREERAEQHRESISRIVTEILKLVIRLDERTQKRG